jgi:hypothetical protein
MKQVGSKKTLRTPIVRKGIWNLELKRIMFFKGKKTQIMKTRKKYNLKYIQILKILYKLINF